MQRFSCPVCSAELFFDDATCAACGTDLAFERGPRAFAPLGDRHACRNRALIGCPWAAPTPGALCSACELTRSRPADDHGRAVEHWALAERATRHVVVELDRLGLAVEPRRGDEGLAIEMAWSDDGSVTIGHAGGVITLDAGEADDARRADLRDQLGERYRTMLGHLRHELGHYWWPRLVGDGGETRLERFRAAFGDERGDYQAAIDRHYAEGPPDGWEDRYVSAYATMHPWEDWAETFAHYLHLRDSLDTAAAFGLRVAQPTLADDQEVDATTSADEHPVDVDRVLHQWGALAVAVNALNRSMDLPDLYPFVLTDAVRAKLRVVADLVDDGPIG